ncbi:MAG TPA: hypothetical protein DEU93_01395 [Chitinophagaceae bacterium]|nr:hypothetical protein [Chitinophagaceae bacterium]
MDISKNAPFRFKIKTPRQQSPLPLALLYTNHTAKPRLSHTYFDITISFYRFALAVADLFIVHPLHSIRNELINEPIRILPRTDYRLYLT